VRVGPSGVPTGERPVRGVAAARRSLRVDEQQAERFVMHELDQALAYLEDKQVSLELRDPAVECEGGTRCTKSW